LDWRYCRCCNYRLFYLEKSDGKNRRPKKKSDDGPGVPGGNEPGPNGITTTVIEPAPAPTPNQGATIADLYDADSGTGKAAVDLRIQKLLANGYGETVATGLGFQDALFSGVKAGNKMKDAILKDGHKLYQLPLPVSNKQKNVLIGIQDIKYSAGLSSWDNMAKVTNSFFDLKKEANFRVFLNGVEGNLENIRNKFFDGVYGKIPSNKKKIEEPQMRQWVEQFQNDARQFASNYLALSEKAADTLREKAIADLRASGWKFVGYDAPGTPTDNAQNPV